MSSFRVVEQLDVIEHVAARILPGRVDSASHPLALEQLEEALGDCVVVTVAAPTRGTRVFAVIFPGCEALFFGRASEVGAVSA